MFSKYFNKKGEKDSDNDSKKVNSGSDSELGKPLTNLTATQLKGIIASLNNAGPVFEKAGYRIEQLDVEFGISPKLTPYFKQLKSITHQRHNEILAEIEGQQLIKFILISLAKSARMQSILEGSELYYYGMQMDISSQPTVRTIFKRVE